MFYDYTYMIKYKKITSVSAVSVLWLSSVQRHWTHHIVLKSDTLCLSSVQYDTLYLGIEWGQSTVFYILNFTFYILL